MTGGHETGIPQVIWYQVLNFGLLLLLLAVLLKKRISEHISNKKDNYLEAVRRVEKAKAEAEQRHAQVKGRLHQLEGSSQESIERARQEAEDLRAKIVAEADALAKNLREEARRSSEAEGRRAIETLRAEVLEASLKMSREAMRDQMKENDQQRLQKEFVEKIQVVAP